jgi:glycosyltransferase involved in cell wall biosynthesis
VLGLCLSYYPSGRIDLQDDQAGGHLRWIAPATGRLRLPAALAHPWRALALLRKFRPDILIGASDAPHVVLTRWLARRLRIPYAVDLYDNFESFSLTRLPGMARAYRAAVRNAGVVTTTSEPLRDLVVDGYKARGRVIAMPSTIDAAVFHPRDKLASRDALGLPPDARLIGTAGGLYADKGITDLYSAWKLLEARDPNLHLVLAGPHEAALPPPQGKRVHWLGPLPHARIADLFCALDVGVMCIRDTPFGRYCFPQKAYEMLACRLPVVAAEVGAMSALFAATPARLYRAGDAANLADRIRQQLQNPTASTLPIEDWVQLIGRIVPELQRLMALNPPRAS